MNIRKKQKQKFKRDISIETRSKSIEHRQQKIEINCGQPNFVAEIKYKENRKTPEKLRSSVESLSLESWNEQ